jgi:hypothetical protein
MIFRLAGLMEMKLNFNKLANNQQATQREALARQNGRSLRVCLELSLVTFFLSRERK